MPTYNRSMGIGKRFNRQRKLIPTGDGDLKEVGTCVKVKECTVMTTTGKHRPSTVTKPQKIITRSLFTPPLYTREDIEIRCMKPHEKFWRKYNEMGAQFFDNCCHIHHLGFLSKGFMSVYWGFGSFNEDDSVKNDGHSGFTGLAKKLNLISGGRFNINSNRMYTQGCLHGEDSVYDQKHDICFTRDYKIQQQLVNDLPPNDSRRKIFNAEPWVYELGNDILKLEDKYTRYEKGKPKVDRQVVSTKIYELSFLEKYKDHKKEIEFFADNYVVRGTEQKLYTQK